MFADVGMVLWWMGGCLFHGTGGCRVWIVDDLYCPYIPLNIHGIFLLCLSFLSMHHARKCTRTEMVVNTLRNPNPEDLGGRTRLTFSNQVTN